MNEYYDINETSDVTPEFSDFSEANRETVVDENQAYERAIPSYSQEFVDYTSVQEKEESPRSRVLLRKNKSRLGRLISMLATALAPAIAVILIVAGSVFADVTAYSATSDSLSFNFKLYSSEKDTVFTAVLSVKEEFRDGFIEIDQAEIDPQSPHADFMNLNPKTEYLLEVWADGEVRLSLTYMTSAVDSDEVRFTEEEHVSGATWANVVIRVKGIDPADLRAFVGGIETETETDGDLLIIRASDLDPQMMYLFTVEDQNGNQLYESTLNTIARRPATIKNTGFSCGMSEAWLVFSVDNPDENAITADFDGKLLVSDISGDEIRLEFTGLGEHSDHVVVFCDYDGTIILEYSFTTAFRTSASVELINAESKYESADGSNGSFCIIASYGYTNPDGNDIRITVGGTVYDAEYSDGTVLLHADNLDPSKDYEIVFTDYDGSVLLSHTVRTIDRIKATAETISSVIGIREATAYVSITNPHNNGISISPSSAMSNGEIFEDPKMSGTSASVHFTGLRPGTSYSFEVMDEAFGEIVYQFSFTTPDAFTVRQDENNNLTVTLTDAFKEAYSTGTVTVTDSLGYQIPLKASSDSAVFTASAADLMYADTYSISVYVEGAAIDTVESDLSGNERPSYTVRYLPASAALLSDARSYGSSYSAECEYRIRYTKPGYLPASPDDVDSDGLMFAYVMCDSAGKVKATLIEGYADASIRSQPTEEESLWFDGKNSPLDAGTYTFDLYLLEGYTREQIDQIVWRDQTPGFNEFGEIILKEGRPLASSTLTAEGSKSFAYASVYPDEVSLLDNARMAVSPSVAYYEEGTGFNGYLTIVKASAPTVQVITPIELGKEYTYGKMDRIILDFSEPFYAIVYQDSFSASNFVSIYYYSP